MKYHKKIKILTRNVQNTLEDTKQDLRKNERAESEMPLGSTMSTISLTTEIIIIEPRQCGIL